MEICIQVQSRRNMDLEVRGGPDDPLRLVIGLLIIVVALAFAARRGLTLFKLIRSGQPVAPPRPRR